MIPLYGFLEGDTIGLIVLADEEETVRSLADKLQQAASVRVQPRAGMSVVYRGRTLDPRAMVGTLGIPALARFDVVADEGTG